MNNNAVVAVDEQGEEHVLFGRGLGFELTVGGAADMQRV
nr:CAT RNA binding domain-containing protein [Actinomyces bowdenii]